MCTVALLAASGVPAPEANPEARRTCNPTLPGSRVPGYRPGAPVRSSVGAGHVLLGVVHSSRNCAPIAHARLEFFQAGPDGVYSVRPSWAYRATLFSRRDGSYRFESPIPGKYRRGTPHIHVRASAPGGTESSCSVTGVGAGFSESSDEDNELQPAKPRLAAAITIIRRMGHPPL